MEAEQLSQLEVELHHYVSEWDIPKLRDGLTLVQNLIRDGYNWGAYSRLFPSHPSQYKHLIGKDETWKIERKSLNFRTHLGRLNRKTICFSKNEKIHDNVIGIPKYRDRKILF